MRLLRFYGENILSYLEIDVRVDNQGLVFIHGENKDDPNTNSNGSGKTGVLDLISTVLFGKTTKGLECDDLINRTAGKNMMCAGSLIDDECDGAKYKIVRYRKHSDYKGKPALFLYRGKTDISGGGTIKEVQEKINKLLGLDFDTFCQSVLFSQNASISQKGVMRFAEGTDSQKKEILEKILNVDVLTDCLKHTRDLIKAKSSEFQIQMNQLEVQKDNLEKEKNLFTELQEQDEKFEDDKQERIDRLGAEIGQIKSKCGDLEKSLLDIDTKIIPQDALNSQLKGHNKTISSIKEKCKKIKQKAEAEINPKETELRSNEMELGGIKSRLKGYKDLSNTKCPTCEQEIPMSHIAAITAELLERGKELGAAIAPLKEEIVALTASVDEKMKMAEKFEQEEGIKAEAIQKSIQEMYNLERTRSGWESDLKVNESQIADRTKHLEEWKAKTSDIKSTIDKSKKRVKETKKKIKEIENSIKDISSEVSHLEFWEKGFGNKGLKSYIMDSVVPFLNEQVNKYCAYLAKNLNVRFRTQSRNKSGELKEDFNIEVLRKDDVLDAFTGGHAVGYKTLSGGERKRIDLCVALALQGLVSERSMKRFNIAMFDEAFESLDEVGVESAIQLLNHLAKEKESIFIISHLDELKSRFQKNIKVVKEHGISQIV